MLLPRAGQMPGFTAAGPVRVFTSIAQGPVVSVMRLSDEAEADSASLIAPQGPYGGDNQSGTGRAGGVEGLYEFQQVKNIRIAMG